jgi:broad specificity polyphosphatase/5'/3'-nucleotidase SurE
VNTGADPQTGDVDFSATNAFVVQLVGALVDHASGVALLPSGLGLNINVPFSPNDGAPAGVQVTTTDRSSIDPDYSGVELPAVGESIAIEAEFATIPPVDPGSDAAVIDAGLVSITFIEGNYDIVENSRVDEVAALTLVLTAMLQG